MSACVPTTMSTVPRRSPSAIRRRSAAPVRFVSSSTRTGRSPSSVPGSGTVSPSSSAREREVVLLGEHLGRRHERALVATLHADEQRGERDDGLARADLALEQPVHRRGRARSRGDLVDRLLAGRRSARTGASAWNAATSGPSRRDRVLDAAPVALEGALARDQPDLHAQELVELQPLRGAPRASSSVCGPVDVAGTRRCGRRATSTFAARRRAGRRSRVARRALQQLARRACAAATCTRSAFPDCGYTGTITPVVCSPARVEDVDDGFVIWRRPR